MTEPVLRWGGRHGAAGAGPRERRDEGHRGLRGLRPELPDQAGDPGGLDGGRRPPVIVTGLDDDHRRVGRASAPRPGAR
ncbi:MAG: hypothetical protein ACLPUO_22655 [Streptosporangiaceae bacterium]